MRILIIAIFLAISIFRFFLKYLTYTRRNAPLPANVQDVFDAETYKKSQAYEMEKLKYSIVTDLIGMVVSLAFLLLNFHFSLYQFISEHTTNIYLTSLFILLLPDLIGSIIDRLTDIYSTFGIEAKYEFNKTTPKTFIADTIKMGLVNILIMGGLFCLFLFLFNLLGNAVFVVFFFILLGFVVLMRFLSPFILKLMYKYTPLEDGELKDKIEEFAKNAGYDIEGIYVVDGSRRSTKANAFATGFGKSKRIGLFDTLVEQFTHDEIVAVLAHEIGHAKLSHMLKSVPLNLISFAIALGVAYFVLTMPEVSQDFGFADVNIAFAIYVLFIMISPLILVLRIPSQLLSRKHEYEADAYAAKHCNPKDMISCLKKLNRIAYSNLTPHQFVVMMEYSHPPLSQRIAALENYISTPRRSTPM